MSFHRPVLGYPKKPFSSASVIPLPHVLGLEVCLHTDSPCVIHVGRHLSFSLVSTFFASRRLRRCARTHHTLLLPNVGRSVRLDRKYQLRNRCESRRLPPEHSITYGSVQTFQLKDPLSRGFDIQQASLPFLYLGQANDPRSQCCGHSGRLIYIR